ncbi:MAG: DUF4417 domain-containing protein [Clostridiales bacterium]|nr:DUF4417 domain-containing protein [Clostridiales bacterium]
MTEENYNYRTSPFLLRNQFDGKSADPFKIPDIPKATFTAEEFNNLLLLGFDRTSLENTNHLDRMVHFFLYDYKFEKVWKNPDTDIEKLKRYKAVLSPDFSMYREMNPTIQLYNTFRNRWCGAYFASKGIRVIPTVSWGDENTFDYCFSGIPKGSTVAVSTYMVSAHNNHADQKDFFLKGYNEMLKAIEPERIICYNNPFPEMEGNIVYVDYELSSWKYQNDDYIPSKFAKYICGEQPLPTGSNLVIKSGWIAPYSDGKGMGSAYGGKWQPKKTADERFLGKPGEIKEYIKPNGERYLTKIGIDGRAIMERHLTDHHRAHTGHTNPHDHKVLWNNPVVHPDMGESINYPDGNIPEFKNYKGLKSMYTRVQANSPEENRFKTISDFKCCMKYHGEVEFVWNNKIYNIVHDPDGIVIYEAHKGETECKYQTADEVLEYLIDGVRLRDIITEAEVTERTI